MRRPKPGPMIPWWLFEPREPELQARIDAQREAERLARNLKRRANRFVFAVATGRALPDQRLTDPLLETVPPSTVDDAARKAVERTAVGLLRLELLLGSARVSGVED